MVVAAVLVLVVVLAGLAIWALRRRGVDELHSVAGYQHRLERLEELRRRQLGTVRPPGSDRRENHAEQVVIGERIGSLDRPPAQDALAARRRSPSRGRRDLAIARMGHRPRRLGAPIAAAVAVVIVVIGLALAGAHAHGPRSSPPTTVRASRGARHAHRTTTTTTTPRPTTFTAASLSGSRATYDLPFASYSLSVSATADCYLQVTSASGQVPYASVLHAGQTVQLTLTGDSTVVLGAPSYAQVQIDRTPVTFPTPLPAPLDLVLNAATPAGSSTTTTSPTTTTSS
jgi:hypothetical protein